MEARIGLAQSIECQGRRSQRILIGRQFHRACYAIRALDLFGRAARLVRPECGDIGRDQWHRDRFPYLHVNPRQY